MAIKLYGYQLAALRQMHNGCILCGGVGSGKSLTALAYYYTENGGVVNTDSFMPMKTYQDLYIITTARKRDTCEWNLELAHFLLGPGENNDGAHKVVIDSWNNIKKYVGVKNAFFIFDEQRVVGYGAWAKSFIKIAKDNDWILLSATPGDSWMDYIPVFIANGFYRNKYDFVKQHVVYSRFSKYPKVDRYLNDQRLKRLRRRTLVDMDFTRKTRSHHEDIDVGYDIFTYKDVGRRRWDPYKDEPIQNISGLCYIWRRIVNSDEERQTKLLELFEKHEKIIVFYNFDYELDILRSLSYGDDVEIAEWNGHKHQEIPDSSKWVYLVQYTAGCEGWNCIKTDTVIFYSQNYSYKVMRQAAGRIDRLNTPYTDLYYYHLKSKAPIDVAIARALKKKKKFNETRWINTGKV